MNTLLEKIKDAVSIEHGMGIWTNICNNLPSIDNIDGIVTQIAERYATEKARLSCEATLKKASENGKVFWSTKNEFYQIDKSSITDPSNIVIL